MDYLTTHTSLSPIQRGFVLGFVNYKPVSVHLAEGFQRRRLKCEKLTDDGCQVMAKAHIAFGKVS
jgi:hypothetical protein